MAQPKLKTIPMEKLHVSRLNMRHGRKAPDVSDILPGIRAKGIRLTLFVREEEEEEEERSPAEIAEHFGITKLKVRRVLALAGLKPAIRTLLGKDEIDGSTARALTLATKAQQTEWLRLFKSEDERAPMGQRCKAWVTGGTTISTDAALFDIETYDGEIRADLFGEQSVFADAAAFWKAQSAAISTKVESCLYTRRAMHRRYSRGQTGRWRCFPNLFAGGGAARSVSGPAESGYLPAMGLETAVVLGRIAGREAAGEVLAKTTANPSCRDRNWFD